MSFFCDEVAAFCPKCIQRKPSRLPGQVPRGGSRGCRVQRRLGWRPALPASRCAAFCFPARSLETGRDPRLTQPFDAERIPRRQSWNVRGEAWLLAAAWAARFAEVQLLNAARAPRALSVVGTTVPDSSAAQSVVAERGTPCLFPGFVFSRLALRPSRRVRFTFNQT